jgi:hypothetical protein
LSGRKINLGNAALGCATGALGGAAGKAAANLAGKIASRFGNAGKAAKQGDRTFGDAQFIADKNGNIVDLKSTPKGRFTHPDGRQTDILQKHEHPGQGFSHTHTPGSRTTTRQTQPVSATDVYNIATGTAFPK